MTLRGYLRLRRLTLARRRFAEAADSALIKTIALDLGFGHLRRFARAYRDLFGERPSETLARSRGERALPPTRRPGWAVGGQGGLRRALVPPH